MATREREIDVIIVKRLDNEVITCELRTIKDNINTYYEIIGCRSIDIVCRYFNNVHFDIVLDDEGLLKANETNEWPTSWWQREGYTPPYEGLFGVLVLAHHDDTGDLTSATPEDLLAVQASYAVVNRRNGEGLGLLFHQVEKE